MKRPQLEGKNRKDRSRPEERIRRFTNGRQIASLTTRDKPAHMPSAGLREAERHARRSCADSARTPVAPPPFRSESPHSPALEGRKDSRACRFHAPPRPAQNSPQPAPRAKKARA